MIRYEYKAIIGAGEASTPEELSRDATALGAEGWEYCGQSSVVVSEWSSHVVVMFKRELPPLSPNESPFKVGDIVKTENGQRWRIDNIDPIAKYDDPRFSHLYLLCDVTQSSPPCYAFGYELTLLAQ